jgi:hypothetical protein
MDNESILTLDCAGNQFWRNKDGRLHRLDGPAIHYNEGLKMWYKNGRKHRLDGPAAEWPDGTKHWYKSGKFHRLDGPAVDSILFEKEWYKNGKKFKDKDAFFEALTEEEKKLALFSKDFFNG